MDGETQSKSSSDKFIKCASMRMDAIALLDSMNSVPIYNFALCYLWF